MKLFRLVFLALFLIASASAQDAAKPKHATVSGTVTDATTKQPIVKAVVTLRPINAVEPEPKSVLTATTDATGHYEFPDVSAGEYHLNATKATYLPTSYQVRSASHSRRTTVSVADAKDLSGMDLVMSRGGVISGRVLNEDGEPFPNAQVAAYGYVRTRQAGKTRLLPTSRPVQSDDRGEYRMFDLPAGTYYVQCSVNREVNPQEIDKTVKRAYPRTFYPAASSAESATPIVVTAGGEAVANFALTTAPAFTVKGNVIGVPDQTPVLVMISPAGPQFSGPEFSTLSRVHSFEIPGLLPGTYVLTAQELQSAEEERRFATRKITISDSDLQNVTISFNNVPQSIAGTIQILGDRKLDPSTLYLTLSGSATAEDDDELQFRFFGGGFAQPKKDGSFTFSPNESNRKLFVNVNAQSGGFEDWYIKSVFFAGRDVTDSGFTPVSGSSLQVFLSPNGATVEGMVVDKDGHPVPGTEVTTIPEEGRRERRDLHQSASSNQLGKFKIRGVPPGKYKLMAVEEDETQSILDPEFQKQNLSKGTDLTIEEKGRYNVSVTVIPTEAEKSGN